MRCDHGISLAVFCADCEAGSDWGMSMRDPERGHVTPVGCWLLVALAVTAGLGLAVWGATR